MRWPRDEICSGVSPHYFHFSFLGQIFDHNGATGIAAFTNNIPRRSRYFIIHSKSRTSSVYVHLWALERSTFTTYSLLPEATACDVWLTITHITRTPVTNLDRDPMRPCRHNGIGLFKDHAKRTDEHKDFDIISPTMSVCFKTSTFAFASEKV